MNVRILLILNTLYRRWASARLAALRPWIAGCALRAIYAGAAPQGAEDAWLDLAIDMEDLKLRAIQYCGGTIDIAKLFDQVSRVLVEALARQAGIPEKVLSAYLRFQESLVIYNTIAGVLGVKYQKRCGIPQGDPLSMMFIALIMRPWVVMMQVQHKVRPSVLVDDIMLLANGAAMLNSFVAAMGATHAYLSDMGATLAPNKSFNFASTSQAMDFLASIEWEHLGGDKVQVSSAFRYLGAQISVTKDLAEQIVSERFARATAMAKRLARLPISTATKLRTIVSKLLPMAMYGVEAASPSEAAIAKLTAAFLDCLAGTAKPRDLDAIFSRFALKGIDIDPVVQILVRRATAVRICLAKRTMSCRKMTKTIRGCVARQPMLLKGLHLIRCRGPERDG